MNEIFNVISRISTPGGQTSEGKSVKFGVALMTIVVLMGVIELAMGQNPLTAFATIFTGSGAAAWLIRAFSVARMSLKGGLSDMLQNPEFTQLMRDFLAATDTATTAAVQNAKASPPPEYAVIVTLPNGEVKEFPAPNRPEAVQMMKELKDSPEFQDPFTKFHVK